VQLQAVIQRNHCAFGGPPLRHRDSGDVEFTADVIGDAVIDAHRPIRDSVATSPSLNLVF
jgi:hypothetical protein